MKMNVGCGRNIMQGWVNVDLVSLPGIDYIVDFNQPDHERFFGRIDEFLLSHVIEHLTHPLVAMETLWNWAKPGAIMTIRCPHGASDDADEDPTHVRRMFPGSFGYFGQPYYWRADYGYRGDWLVEEIRLFPYDKYQCSHADVLHRRNVIQEMVVTLSAVKPRRQPLRELQNYVEPTIIK